MRACRLDERSQAVDNLVGAVGIIGNFRVEANERALDHRFDHDVRVLPGKLLCGDVLPSDL